LSPAPTLSADRRSTSGRKEKTSSHDWRKGKGGRRIIGHQKIKTSGGAVLIRGQIPRRDDVACKPKPPSVANLEKTRVT